MSWDNLMQQLDRVGRRVGGLADASDAANEKINEAKANLQGLQSQMKNVREAAQFNAMRPGDTAETARAALEMAGEAAPFSSLLPGMTNKDAQKLLERFGPNAKSGVDFDWSKSAANPSHPANRQAWADFMISEAQKRGGGHITNDLVQLIDDRVNQRQQAGLSDADIRDINNRLSELQRLRS